MSRTRSFQRVWPTGTYLNLLLLSHIYNCSSTSSGHDNVYRADIQKHLIIFIYSIYTSFVSKRIYRERYLITFFTTMKSQILAITDYATCKVFSSSINDFSRPSRRRRPWLPINVTRSLSHSARRTTTKHFNGMIHQ